MFSLLLQCLVFVLSVFAFLLFCNVCFLQYVSYVTWNAFLCHCWYVRQVNNVEEKVDLLSVVDLLIFWEIDQEEKKLYKQIILIGSSYCKYILSL